MPSKAPGANHSFQHALRMVYRLIGELLAGMENNTDMEQTPPPGLSEITPTEYTVWKAITAATEPKNRTIYTEWGMSKRNFDNHVNGLYKKLGVKTRSGAVRMWLLYGKVWHTRE